MKPSLEQAEKVTSLDVSIMHNNAVSEKRIKTLSDELAEIKKDRFEKECPDKIHPAFAKCKDAVEKFCNFQDEVNIADAYKLRTYLDDNAKVNYIRANFTSVFAETCNKFAENLDWFLQASVLQTGSEAADRLKKIARDYAVLKDINRTVDGLVKEFVIDVKAKKQRDVEAQISAEEKKKNQAYADGAKDLQEEIDTLNRLIAEEQEGLKDSVLSKDMQMQSEFPEEYSLCIGREVGNNPTVVETEVVKYENIINDEALYLDEFDTDGEMNIVIDCTDGGTSVVDGFVDDVIMKFIASYPTKFKKVVALHNQSGSPLLQIMSRIHACGSQGELAFRKDGSVVANTEEEIETVLGLLDKRINDVCSMLGKEGEQDVFAYNAKNSDNAEPITLVVVKDFPSGFTRGRSLNLFQRVFEQGSRAGIMMIVTYDKNMVKEEYGDAPKAYEFISNLPGSHRLFVENGKMHTIMPEWDFVPLTRAEDFSEKEFFDAVNEELKQQDKPIDLFDVQPKEVFAQSPRRREFSEALYIPLGKDGGQPMALKLSSSDKAHVVVNGGTGSGKTAFLHTLILSAAYNYSPDELEINLFDFKDGVGFKMYKEKRLPHVNFIALENKIEDAQDILMYINSLMTERNKLISSFDGVNSLKGYNEMVATGKYPDKPKIPRCLIVIDEYQFLLMNEKCVNVLENIARQGRSAGMSLVLVSQDVPTDSGFTKIKQLLDHRFAFRGSPENVDRLISGAGKRAAELELQKGLCFYEANDGRIKSMRTAFSGDDAKLSENIDKIVAKYPGKHRPLQIVGSPKPLTVASMSEISTLPNLQLKKDYLNSGICRFELGRYCITQEPVTYVANELSTLLVIVGNYLKSKQIATSIITSMLRTLRDVEDKRGKIVIADLCEQRRLMNLPSPLTDIIRKKSELEDEGDETTLEAITCYDSDGFEDMVDYIYGVYEQRCDDKSAAIDPIEVILMSADTLNGSGRIFDKLREVIVNGKKCDIYFTIQVESLDSNFSKTVLLQRGGVQVKDLILLSESEDASSRTSMEIRSALNAISGIVGSKVSSEYIKSLEKNPLHHAHSFIVDGGNISKYSHYQYQEGWIDSLINEIK